MDNVILNKTESIEKIINEHLEDFTDFSKIAIHLIPE
jgi:hypothetical protein